ncbi:MAG: carbohydrate kinase family protein [Candidatus Magasanikbacteria bacterium]|nr:carbohydrate kinase family protein [Candidatus Magasanikbacteria bacterium]
MSILVSGSLAYDYIMNFPDSFKNHIMPEQLHILNVCFVVDKLERSWGGTAGNIGYTMKMLGADPLIVSAVGRDAKDYLDHFKKFNIATDHIFQDATKLSASAYITTDMDDNQVTAFYSGPLNDTADIASATTPTPPWKGGEALVSPPARGGAATAVGGGGSVSLAIIAPTDKRAMIKHSNECHSRGIPVMFDPGQQITAFTDVELKHLISQSQFLIGNDYEIKLIQDKTGWDAQNILKETKTLITTLGEKGSIISTSDGEIIEVAPCPPKSVDDPTGAGDAFRAGFLVGYEKGLHLKICAQIGSVAASYAIETYGTQEHSFTKEEFGERYEKTYKEKMAL